MLEYPAVKGGFITTNDTQTVTVESKMSTFVILPTCICLATVNVSFSYICVGGHIESKLHFHLVNIHALWFSLHTVPAPTVIVIVTDGPLYTGTDLTLTCNITLDLAVDFEVTVTVVWSRPGGTLPSDDRVIVSETMGSGPSYQSTLIFTPLTSNDTGDYTCEVTVVTAETTSFIITSQHANDTGSVIVTGMGIYNLPVLSTSHY